MQEQYAAAARVRSVGHWAASVLLGSALLAPGWASAQGGYAGIGAGQSSMKDESDALLGTSFDDSDTGWKLFGGYSFNPNAAVEFAYIDFGEFTGRGGGFTDNWEATGINISAVGSWPLANEFSLLGKIGATRWDVDDNFTVAGVPVSVSENGTDLSYGIGVQYDFTRQVGARLEWERFTDVGDDTTGQSDLDLLSLGVAYKF